jgi:hypothetical protein
VPPVSETVLQELRMRYHAAYTAYQACVRAVAEATMAGSLPSAAMLEHEAKALGALNKLRASLMAAMVAEPGDGESQPGR